jgi:hypothetical protein
LLVFGLWVGWRGPAYGVLDAIVGFAAGAFDYQATSVYAVEEDAAVRGLKLEEIGAAEKFGAVRIFFLQQFAVLAEESGRVIGVVQMQAHN